MTFLDQSLRVALGSSQQFKVHSKIQTAMICNAVKIPKISVFQAGEELLSNKFFNCFTLAETQNVLLTSIVTQYTTASIVHCLFLYAN